MRSAWSSRQKLKPSWIVLSRHYQRLHTSWRHIAEPKQRTQSAPRLQNIVNPVGQNDVLLMQVSFHIGRPGVLSLCNRAYSFTTNASLSQVLYKRKPSIESMRVTRGLSAA